MSTKDLKSVIAGHTALANLAKLAQHKVSINDRITDALPPELADLIATLSIDETSEQLTVTVTTGERASRLRYAQAQLLAACHGAGAPATRCKVQVRPVRREPETDS
ncbi:MAG: DciA family protein [Pseudomonadota bacterium]